MKTAAATLLGVLACALTCAARMDAGEAATEIGRLAARMEPGGVKELVTKNCDHDLFRMWYDWEEDDIKRYGSQKMFDIICWNNDMKTATAVGPAHTSTTDWPSAPSAGCSR